LALLAGTVGAGAGRWVTDHLSDAGLLACSVAAIGGAAVAAGAVLLVLGLMDRGLVNDVRTWDQTVKTAV